MKMLSGSEAKQSTEQSTEKWWRQLNKALKVIDANKKREGRETEGKRGGIY